MNYYVEVRPLQPTKDKITWGYGIDASDSERAKHLARLQYCEDFKVNYQETAIKNIQYADL